MPGEDCSSPERTELSSVRVQLGPREKVKKDQYAVMFSDWSVDAATLLSPNKILGKILNRPRDSDGNELWDPDGPS